MFIIHVGVSIMRREETVHPRNLFAVFGNVRLNEEVILRGDLSKTSKELRAAGGDESVYIYVERERERERERRRVGEGGEGV